jgi:STE24 endopeptidase
MLNSFGIIVLSTIIFSFLLELFADFLNLKNLKKDLPKGFENIYEKDKYFKSQEYLKENTKFSYWGTLVSMIFSLSFWFMGGFNYLEHFVSQYTENTIIKGIMFIGIYSIINSIISFPFSVYSTFIIEEKYGFNKTTVKTFIMDILKGTLLAVLIGIPLLALMLYIVSEFGQYSWLYAWIAVILFSLILQYIAPTWIMPLFNKFTPLEDGELRNQIFDLAKKVDFPLNNVFVIDGSKRSNKSNAFFTGFGKNKRIALYDTLIESQSNGELLSVLAHEIGHYKKKHIIQGMIISILHTGMVLYLLSIFMYNPEIYKAFLMDSIPVYAGWIFFMMVFSPVEMIISILMNMLSRKNEFEADEFAVRSRANKDDMINALKKLSVHNLSNLTPHPFYVFLNYSHPTVIDRIKAIENVKV